MLQDGRRGLGVVLAGIGVGLSVSSKFSAVVSMGMPVLACLVAVAAADGGLADCFPARAQCLERGHGGFGPSHCGRCVRPYQSLSLLDWEQYRLAVIDMQGGMVSGAHDWPFTRQYRHTLPYLYFLRQQLQFGLWYPLGIAALAGCGWLILRAAAFATGPARSWLLRPKPGEWVILAWVVPYFLLTGAFLAKFNRYMIPCCRF